MRRDAFWTSISTLLAVVSQLGIMFWLSQDGDLRLIGQLAILGIALGLAGYLQDFGISNFYISEPDLNEAKKNQLFYLTIALAGFSSLLLAMSAPHIAMFYEEQKLSTYLQMIALQIFVQGVGNQSQAILIKQHQLQKLAHIDIVSRLFMLLAFSALQQQIGGIMSFVIANLISSTIRTIVLLRCTRQKICVRPGLIDRYFLKRAFNYGLYQSGSQFLGYFRHRLDQLILGKMLGLENLGQYSMAREINQQPFKILNPVITRLFLPRFTIYSEKQINLYDALQLSLRSHLVAFSVLALLCVIFIDDVLPTDFSDVTVLVTTMLPYAVLKAPGMVFAIRAQSMGNVRREFNWNMWSSLFMLPLMIALATQESLVAITLMLSIWQNLMAFIALRYFVDAEEDRLRCYPLLLRFSAGSWIFSLMIAYLVSYTSV